MISGGFPENADVFIPPSVPSALLPSPLHYVQNFQRLRDHLLSDEKTKKKNFLEAFAKYFIARLQLHIQYDPHSVEGKAS